MRVWFAKYDKYLICEDGFRNNSINGIVHGFSLRLRLPKYRGIPLSCIEKLLLRIDGAEVNQRDINFCVNNKRFMIAELPALYAEWWDVRDKAELYVEREGGLKPGEHDVEVSLTRRETYMYVEQLHGFLRVPAKDAKKLVLEH